MRTPDRMLPVAILGAGALIGAGLFFGLQQRGTAPEDTPAARGSQHFLPERAEAGAPISVPAPTQELRARVGAQVLDALEAERARLVKTCWAPSVARARDPVRAEFQFRFEFNPKG